MGFCYSNSPFDSRQNLSQDMGALRSLVSLLCSSNGLTTLPMDVCALRGLEVLVLDDNRLQVLVYHLNRQ